MDKYTIEYLVVVFLVTVHLAVLVLLGIADNLSALPGQHHTKLWSAVMALHQTFHLGEGQTIILPSRVLSWQCSPRWTEPQGHTPA